VIFRVFRRASFPLFRKKVLFVCAQSWNGSARGFFFFRVPPSLSGSDDGRCGPMSPQLKTLRAHPLFFPLFFVFGSSRTLLHITVYTRHRFSHLPATGASSSLSARESKYFSS
jgi:hypothetical protein